ncbi:MAG: PilZ domain-containing protein [Desulfobacterales bacterium]|nr:PilZ domain-containing protein [Desulfobacterales bacterium]MDX2512002.1 PilZ domain-containing protein [Desulfobacterales bacterium]
MMSSEEELERYLTIGRLVELIQKMSGGSLKKLLGQLEKEMPGKNTDESVRRHVRVDCFVSVDYTDSEKVFKDYIEDISTSGVFIKTREAFSVGEEIVLSMSLSKEGSAFKIPATVVRAAPDGIGVRFKITSQVQEAIIESLIESVNAQKDSGG